MEYRILGRTGLSVSAIALGCEGFMNKTEEQVCKEMNFAISKGVNFIDIYSSNPELRSNIGTALLNHREKFIIQGHLCSAWENGQYLRTREVDKTIAAFEEQLRLLKTDFLDIGMIHYVDSESDFHVVFDGPILQLALRWKEEGKIRYIGLSSHNPTVARLAVETGMIDVLMFSINPCYDLQPASENVDDLCEQTGVAIDVMKVYGGGDLLSDANSPFEKALTPAQCIEYALTRPGVAAVMVGCKNCEEIQAALDWCEATKEEKDENKLL